MRRYYIVSGILLILPIINFAVAAPVLVQEKRQAVVDVAHIPKDVITMLGKRGDSETFEELLLKLFGVPEDHYKTRVVVGRTGTSVVELPSVSPR
jgi:hypothetical protein